MSGSIFDEEEGRPFSKCTNTTKTVKVSCDCVQCLLHVSTEIDNKAKAKHKLLLWWQGVHSKTKPECSGKPTMTFLEE
jgi:hypothetical protein